MRPLLELDQLTFVYPHTDRGVAGLSLRLPGGKKIALVGANGSGKSTLLLLAAGCLQPLEGRVRLDGRECAGQPQLVRRYAGVLFQDPDHQLFMPSVREEVLCSLGNSAAAPDFARGRQVAAMLDALGIAHLAERPPHRLSVGEKKRVALAALLVNRPQLLLLDEPSAGLDPRSRRALINLLREMDMAMLLATHDLDLALDIADEAVILNSGKIVGRSGTPGLLADEEYLRAQGLELPLSLNRARG